jgi:aminoglycoside phosphotransferase (APT) family kinase protein
MSNFIPTPFPLDQRIGNGRTAEVYALGEHEVLKLYQPWMDPAFILREYMATRAAAESGFPVAAAHQLVQVGERYGVVLERVSGISLLEELQRHPARLTAVARQLADLHVRLNRCPAPPDLPNHREQMRSAILRTKALSTTQRESILFRLEALPTGSTLCHGDFHPENVLLTAHGPVVIDWMTATRGLPASDLMRSSMILETASLPPTIPPLQRRLLTTARGVLLAAYRREYLRRLPLSFAERESWRLPLLAERLVEVNDYPVEKALILQNITRLLSI